MSRPSLRDVPADHIRDTDSPYRFRFRTDDAFLTRSVQDNGLLAPVGVVPADGDGYILLYGFRRMAAARTGGMKMIPCMVFDPSPGAAEALALILADNRGTALDVLDRAGLLALGQRLTGMDDRHFATVWSDLTGEKISFKELGLARILAEADTSVREAVHTGKMPPAAAGLTAQLSPEDRDAILRATVLAGLDLSRSGYEEFFNLVRDIAARDQVGIKAVLQAPDLRTVTDDTEMTPQQKGAKYLGILRSKRFPLYSGHLARYEKEKAAAENEFRGRARFSTPRFFEHPDISLTLTAAGAEELAAMLAHYDTQAALGAFDDMFRLAGGECP